MRSVSVLRAEFEPEVLCGFDADHTKLLTPGISLSDDVVIIYQKLGRNVLTGYIFTHVRHTSTKAVSSTRLDTVDLTLLLPGQLHQ